MLQTNTSHISPELEDLFTSITKACDQIDKRKIVADLKERHPNPASIKDDDLLGTFHELYWSGKITQDGLGILYSTAEKSKNKDLIISHLDQFKGERPTNGAHFIGRSKEKHEILKLLTDQAINGINIHGVQGVGKTTIAKEVGKELEQDSWEIITFNMREAKDIDTAYLFILFKLGHTAISRNSHMMGEKWIREKERNLILSSLQDRCKTSQKILLLFDNVESELIERDQDELICFFNGIIDSKAVEPGMLKVVLTSRIPIPDFTSIRNHFLEELQSSTSKDLICRRSKLDLQSDVLKDDDEEALAKVAEYCQQIPYLLEGAEHLLRSGFITSQNVLKKIEAQIAKGVPKEYVTTATLFDSIPTDNLKKLAVQLCVFPKSFSSSEVEVISELKSNYDASLDLEHLTNNRVISKVITKIKLDDGKTESKTEYEIHSLFQDFATSFLRVQFPVYQASYNEAEVKFGQYFAEKMLKLADTLDTDFAETFLKIQKDKISFEVVLKLSNHYERILEKLISSPQHEIICRVAMFLETLKNFEDRKTLFKIWAEALEKKGNLLTSAYMRCWEAIQLADMEGTAPSERILDHAEECLSQAAHSADGEQFNAVKGFLLFCKGKLNCMKSVYFTSKKHREEKNDLLKKALQQCEGALEINRNLYYGHAHTMTVRTLNCIGNCYMELDQPATAEIYYGQALEMKLELTKRNEKHSEIPTFYNQLSQVYQKLGDFKETNKSIIDRAFRRLSQDAKTHYELAVFNLKKSIELNKELDLDDTLGTATFNRNLANIFIALKRYDEALECAEKSYEVRNKLLGQHPETVRILYLMGVINEWRKHHRAALFNYEEAFNMEESLPQENHSVVKDLVCDRLEAMCKECNEKVKLRELKPRIKLLRKLHIIETHHEEKDPKQQKGQQEKHDETVPKEHKLTLDKFGGNYNLSDIGITLQIPAGALQQQTKLTVRGASKDTFSSPAGELDAVVSSMIQFEPSDLVFEKPIDVTLVHNGPLHTAHYENVAMGYNDVTNTWEEIQELKNPSTSDSATPSSIKVQLTKLTAVTVVTRLILDTFEVPVTGCQVKSSICPEVTLDFPRQAVDKVTKGSLKVLPMPEVLPSDIPQELHFCPIVVVGGFNDKVFSEDVTLTVPYPTTCRPAGYERDVGQIHVMQYEGREWKDVTDVVHCSKSESTIEIRVKHFSMLWLCLTVGTLVGTVTVIGTVAGAGARDVAFYLYNLLKSPPKPVQFLAYRFMNVKPIENLKILLVLVSDIVVGFNMLRQISDSEIYKELTRVTGEEDMYPTNKVYPKVKGGFELQSTDIALRLATNGFDNKELEFVEKRFDCDDERLIVEFHLTQDAPCKRVGRITVTRRELGLGPREAFCVKKGLLVVIELDFNENPGLKREGSSQDTQALLDTFVGRFKFKWKHIQNKKEHEILAELEESLKKFHATRNCCTVSILSHGELGSFFDINLNNIKENKITSIMKKYFHGKPKLLFIQTCRILPDKKNERDIDTSLEPNPSKDAEMLIGYSCCEGRESYRDEGSGSLFIQTLCEVFEEKFSDMDVTSMLCEVNKRVKSKEPHQVCEHKTSLSKKVYFQ